MRRMIPWAALAVLALGSLVGCRSAAQEDEAVTEVPRATLLVQYPWPSIKCPVGNPLWSARDRLTWIFFWANLDNEGEIAELAEECRDEHYAGPAHVYTPELMSKKVWDAFQAAKKAWRIDLELEPGRAEEKKNLWLSCKNELDHDP